jgi:predicted porin
MWVGAKYALSSNLDVSAAYYYDEQNNYSGKECPNSVTKSSKCAGHTNDVSALIDWRPVKRIDLYTGVLYSAVNGGMANGLPETASSGNNSGGVHSNLAWTSGLRIAF